MGFKHINKIGLAVVVSTLAVGLFADYWPPFIHIGFISLMCMGFNSFDPAIEVITAHPEMRKIANARYKARYSGKGLMQKPAPFHGVARELRDMEREWRQAHNDRINEQLYEKSKAHHRREMGFHKERLDPMLSSVIETSDRIGLAHSEPRNYRVFKKAHKKVREDEIDRALHLLRVASNNKKSEPRLGRVAERILQPQ